MQRLLRRDGSLQATAHAHRWKLSITAEHFQIGLVLHFGHPSCMSGVQLNLFNRLARILTQCGSEHLYQAREIAALRLITTD